MEEKNLSGYKITNIILLESIFTRKPNLDFSKQSQKDLNVNTRFSITPDNKLVCTVELTYSLTVEGERAVNCVIKMTGVFEKVGNPVIEEEKFGKINAPSIIFPFVREHLASLSQKALLHQILLPPVNFVNLSQEKK